MLATEAFGHEYFDPLPQQFLPAPAKQLDRLGVDQHHFAVAVDDHHRIGRRFEQILELLVGSSAISGVAYRTHHHRAFLGLERAQADFDGKLLAAVALRVEVEHGAHGADAWTLNKTSPVRQVCGAKACRQQYLDRLTQEFGTQIPKHLFGLCVDEHDAPGHVDHHDRVRQGLKQILKTCLDQLGVAHHLQVRDVLVAGNKVRRLATRVANYLG